MLSFFSLAPSLLAGCVFSELGAQTQVFASGVLSLSSGAFVEVRIENVKQELMSRKSNFFVCTFSADRQRLNDRWFAFIIRYTKSPTGSSVRGPHFLFFAHAFRASRKTLFPRVVPNKSILKRGFCKIFKGASESYFKKTRTENCRVCAKSLRLYCSAATLATRSCTQEQTTKWYPTWSLFHRKHILDTWCRQLLVPRWTLVLAHWKRRSRKRNRATAGSQSLALEGVQNMANGGTWRRRKQWVREEKVALGSIFCEERKPV